MLLLRALDRGAWTSVGAWGAAILLAVAAHPYGALVLAAQGVFVLAARRDRLAGRRSRSPPSRSPARRSGSPISCSRAGSTSASAGAGAKLGGPWAIVTYLWQTAGDFSTGRWPVLVVVLVLALVGLVGVPRGNARLALCVVGVPVAAFLAARLGGSTSPESRHLIFVLPFFAILVGAGIGARDQACAGRGRRSSTAVLVVLEVSWAWHRTPQLFEWEPNKRQATRAQAETFLATTSRPDDLLFGYEPLYLGAWERNDVFPDVVLPRADARLALRTLASGSRSHSVAASGSSTRASGTTSGRGSRSRTATPARRGCSRPASSARSSSSARASR